MTDAERMPSSGSMKLGSLSEPSLFELVRPEGRANPYPIYRRFRETASILWQPPAFWAVSSYDLVTSVLRDRRFGTADLRSIRAMFMQAEGNSSFMDRLRKTMLMRNPPDHMRLRGIVSKAFSPRMINSLGTRIQEITDELLSGIHGHSFDVISDVAFPLPVMVIAEMLGVPDQDREHFRRWARAMVGSLDLVTDPAQVEAADLAADECESYLAGLVEQRRRDPREDLLSALAVAEDEGRRLTQEELLANAMLLLLAGHETTVNLIGNGTLNLLRNPDQAEMLREEPSLAPSAIEEVLRYESPVQLTLRRASEPVEVGGVTIGEGEHVLLMLGAANRDPARFSDPDRLDIKRPDNGHLAFGEGIHYCLGANLARAEGQAAIGTLLRRMPGLRLDATEIQWRDQVTLRSLKELRVCF